jgi:hypothetical protein
MAKVKRQIQRKYMNCSCDEMGSLLRETLKLINERSDGLLHIANETGVPFYWLRKFTYNEIPSPSVNRVQYLYEKLSGRTLL